AAANGLSIRSRLEPSHPGDYDSKGRYSTLTQDFCPAYTSLCGHLAAHRPAHACDVSDLVKPPAAVDENFSVCHCRVQKKSVPNAVLLLSALLGDYCSMRTRK